MARVITDVEVKVTARLYANEQVILTGERLTSSKIVSVRATKATVRLWNRSELKPDTTVEVKGNLIRKDGTESYSSFVNIEVPWAYFELHLPHVAAQMKGSIQGAVTSFQTADKIGL